MVKTWTSSKNTRESARKQHGRPVSRFPLDRRVSRLHEFFPHKVTVPAPSFSNPFKPIGWGVIEARYKRLPETVRYRLNEFLENRLDFLPELEVKLELVENPDGSSLDNSRNARAATPSWIKMESPTVHS